MNRLLIARKPMTYGTRRLKAGDEFECPSADARLLVAIKKAAFIRMPGEISPPPAAIAQKIRKAAPPAAVVPNELQVLRTEYQKISGKKAFARWDAATLKAKIAAAKK